MISSSSCDPGCPLPPAPQLAQSVVLFFPRKCDGHVCRFVPSFGLNNFNLLPPPLPSPLLINRPFRRYRYIGSTVTWSMLSSLHRQKYNMQPELSTGWLTDWGFCLPHLAGRWKQRAVDNVRLYWLMLAKCVLDGSLPVIIQYLHCSTLRVTGQHNYCLLYSLLHIQDSQSYSTEDQVT